MKYTNHILAGAVITVLLMTGAGCAKQTVQPTAEPSKPVATQPTTVAPTVQPTTEPTTPTVSEPEPGFDHTPGGQLARTPEIVSPIVDDTWGTYTNKALGFSFRWPNKGRYAPTWEVTFVKEQAPLAQLLLINGIEFSHDASTSETVEDKLTFSDRFTTKKGDKIILISFEKTYPKANEAQFDVKAYQDHLLQILSTFKYD
ncbi:MAG: hypothetical protein WCV84_05990 [Patescibacteria group bacterium]